jgi:hypothetical protein
MIVTAITAEGFYVADKLSPPISDPFYTSDATGFRVLPGTFGYIYVYNYNFPDGLYFADRVLSLTGTVQEFSGDTQLVFPSWVRKEDLNQHPEDLPAVVQLDFSNYNDTCPGYFTCANGGTGVPTSLRCLDQCGRAYMEPGQVCDTDSMMPTCTDDSCHAAMPGTHCDAASGSCLGCPQTPCPQGEWCVQRRCVNPNDPCSGPKCPDGERCNPTTGACECGPSLGYRISLTPTWKAAPAVGTFMQQLFAYSNNNVEIESLESAIVKVTNAMPPSVWVSCDANGNSSVPPFSWNVPTLPNGCPDWNNQGWYCYDSGDDTPDCYCNMQCTIGMKPYEFHGNNLCTELTSFRNFGQWQVELEPNWHTHINVMTRDALPDFDPRVFADPMYAGCRVDVTGVLRQVQAARTRWLILARDQNDVCCRAQPGGMCPTPDNGGFCPKCPDAHN